MGTYIFAALALSSILFALGDIILIVLHRVLKMPLTRGQFLREIWLVISALTFFGVVCCFYIKDRYNAKIRAERILAIAGLPSDRISLRFTGDGSVILSERARATVRGRNLTFERGAVTLDVNTFPRAWALAGGVPPKSAAPEKH